jgi:hypothetical protein
VAQRSTVAAGEDGGHPNAAARQLRSADHVDAAVNHMQPPAHDPMADRFLV